MALTGRMHIRNVWAWNFDEEFDAFIDAASTVGAVIALDMEFPGVVQEGFRGVRAERAEEYEVLRASVDLLKPIQLGLAVARPEASPETLRSDLAIQGVWSFNLHFDLCEDLHTEESVAFLASAGIDFPRHALEGVDTGRLGSRLAGSPLIGPAAPWWLTFAGFYDLGYLIKILTRGPQRLPQRFEGFQALLVTCCPRRHELRDLLPYGSLQHLALERGISRCGCAHTAGSDALVTLELFNKVVMLAQESLAVAVPGCFVVPPPGLLPPPGLPPPGLTPVVSPVRVQPGCFAPADAWAASARRAMQSAARIPCGGKHSTLRKHSTLPSPIWCAAAERQRHKREQLLAGRIEVGA